MTADRELLSVLVALEPLDDRKWAYLSLKQRTFDADGLLEEGLSSGERVLVQTAASLWNTGTVDLGYIACAIGGRHLQAIIDAVAVRAGHDLASNANRAVARLGKGSAEQTPGERPPPLERGAADRGRDGPRPGEDRPCLER